MKVRHAAAALAVAAVASPLAIASASTGAPAPVRAAAATTVTTRNTSFGKILVTSSGMPLYVYTSDSRRSSACSGVCAAAWPPLIKHGSLRGRGGVKARKLTTIKRGGSRQVSYAGHPLYTFITDSPGNVTGEGQRVGNGRFFVISASGKVIKK